MRKIQVSAAMAQFCGRTAAASLALGLAASSALADGYIGDMPISGAAAGPDYVNDGATVWTGAHSFATISNPAGASILNQGAAVGEVVSNGGVIRNAPNASWTGDVTPGANVAGAEIVNQGTWTGTLANAGGGLDNSGTVSSLNNAAGVFANEGAVQGDLVNGAQATNSGAIGGRVVNASQFVNNAAGSVLGGLADTGSTTNNGAISGGVTERGAFVNNASGKVSGGFALNAGSAVNNGAIAGGVSVQSGAFADNGEVQGGALVAGPNATLTINHALDGGATVSAGSLVVNAAGTVQGDVVNAGSFANAGTLRGSAQNAGALVNDGVIAGALSQSGGAATNNGALQGGADIAAGQFVNNGAVGGAVHVGAKAEVVDNGVVAGPVSNAGALTVNGSGRLLGALVNSGVATLNGDLAGGASNSGAMTINASGRIENGLTVTGGAVGNAGVVSGGAVVEAGTLASSGEIDGGLVAGGLVQARGTISGPVTVTGRLLVGDAAPDGSTLTLKPGSSVTGVLTLPVDLAAGQSNHLAAAGADLSRARLDLTGRLSGAGAYWGRLGLADTPIALTDSAQQALAAASTPLYRYSVPDGVSLVQTINPGLGATASPMALAAATGFALALAPPPADAQRAPADPTPNLGAGAVWSRGFGAALSQSGESVAATGPAFDATNLATRLAGAQVGAEYGVHNLQNSGLSVALGLAGGEAAGGVTDRAGSGATADVKIPFAAGYATLTGLGFSGRVEARYLRIGMTLDNAPLGVSGQFQRAAGMSYAAQASYRIPAGAYFVEPFSGLSYTRLSVADEATDVGELTFGKARLVLGQAGVKLGGDLLAGALRLRPYALASLGREWLSGATVNVPDGPGFAPVGFGAFEQVGLGLTAALARSNFSGYAQAAWNLGALTGLTASAGVRVDF